MSQRHPNESVAQYEQRLKDEETIRLYDVDGILVVKPLTYESSCLYGRRAKWCVSMVYDGRHWSSFSASGMELYIIINRNLKEDDLLYKVLVAVPLKGGEPYYWDSKNNRIPKPYFVE